MYPNAVHVPDYYHASKHLHEFVGLAFKDAEAGKHWAQEQKNKLLESKTAEVLQAVTAIKCATRQAKENQENLLNYYQDNFLRMDYSRYRKMGCGLIGSGAIESAHKAIIQKRLKQAGQRWSYEGAQNVLNLRVTNGSNEWCKVIRNIKLAAQNAALINLAA